MKSLSNKFIFNIMQKLKLIKKKKMIDNQINKKLIYKI